MTAENECDIYTSENKRGKMTTNNSLIESVKGKEVLNRVISACGSEIVGGKIGIMTAMEISKNPKLAQCSLATIVESMIRAATIGLIPGSGDLIYVPYYTRGRGEMICDVQVTYQGMVKLMYRAGVASIKAAVVYENDKFEHVQGTTESIVHVRAFKDRGEIICAYAIININNNNIIEIMSKEEIDFIRDNCAKDSTSSIWSDFYDEMAKKTVLRRLYKYAIRENIGLIESEYIKHDDNKDYLPKDVSTINAIKDSSNCYNNAHENDFYKKNDDIISNLYNQNDDVSDLYPSL